MQGNPREDYLTGNSRHLIEDTETTEDGPLQEIFNAGKPQRGLSYWEFPAFD